MSALLRMIVNKPVGEYSALDNAVYHLWRAGQNDDLMQTVAELAAAELAQLVARAEERDVLKAAKAESDKLLRDALDLFHGTHELCDESNSEEWIWKWRVRYYFEETDIPVHEMPEDMK